MNSYPSQRKNPPIGSLDSYIRLSTCDLLLAMPLHGPTYDAPHLWHVRNTVWPPAISACNRLSIRDRTRRIYVDVSPSSCLAYSSFSSVLNKLCHETERYFESVRECHHPILILIVPFERLNNFSHRIFHHSRSLFWHVLYSHVGYFSPFWLTMVAARKSESPTGCGTTAVIAISRVTS